MQPRESTYRAIYAVVARIPSGKVATYGQVAKLAGLPRSARLVGWALRALTDPGVPWHRVVNAAGEISRRLDDRESEELQRLRLEREGVVFDGKGRIDLERFRWRPQPDQEVFGGE